MLRTWSLLDQLCSEGSTWFWHWDVCHMGQTTGLWKSTQHSLTLPHMSILHQEFQPGVYRGLWRAHLLIHCLPPVGFQRIKQIFHFTLEPKFKCFQTKLLFLKKIMITLTFKIKIKRLIYNQLFKNHQTFHSFPFENNRPICKNKQKKTHLEIGIPFPDSPGAYPFRNCKSTCY